MLPLLDPWGFAIGFVAVAIAVYNLVALLGGFEGDQFAE